MEWPWPWGEEAVLVENVASPFTEPSRGPRTRTRRKKIPSKLNQGANNDGKARLSPIKGEGRRARKRGGSTVFSREGAKDAASPLRTGS